MGDVLYNRPKRDKTMGGWLRGPEGKRLSSREQAKILAELRRQGKADYTEIQREQDSIDYLESERQKEEARARAKSVSRLHPEMMVLAQDALDPGALEYLRGLAWSTMRAAQADHFRRAQRKKVLMAQAALAWMNAVGSSLMGANITTAKEFAALLANVQILVNSQLEKGLRITFDRYNDQAKRFQFYANQIESIRHRNFFLYVDDSSIMPPAFQNERMMRSFWNVINQHAVEIVYGSLIQAIKECTHGLPARAWPPDYTALLLRKAKALGEPGGPLAFKFYGQDLRAWRVNVDFEKVFGNWRDLEVGFHYGALLKDGSKQDLPFLGSESKFKNEDAKVRYRFWRAMWEGRRVFYGKYKTRRKADQAIRKSFDVRLQQNRQERKDIQRQMARNSWRKSKLFSSGPQLGGYDKKNAQDKYRLKKLKNEGAEIAREGHDFLNKGGPTPIKIPSGLWQDTINRRVTLWDRANVAPIWIYLEFGQLEFYPTIPPRGLTFRFLKIARQKINKMVDDLFKLYVQGAGVTTNKRGQPMYSGKPIVFGPQAGTTPRAGRQLGAQEYQSFLKDFANGVRITKRNAAEARRLLAMMGKAAPPDTSGQLFGLRPPEAFVPVESSRYASEVGGLRPNIPRGVGTRASSLVSMHFPRRNFAWEQAHLSVPSSYIGPHTLPGANKYKDHRNFGQRMRDRRKLAQMQADRATASSLGMSYGNYLKFRERQARTSERLANNAKIRAEKERARAKERADRKTQKAKDKARLSRGNHTHRGVTVVNNKLFGTCTICGRTYGG